MDIKLATSTAVDIFFSCSFRKEDEDVNLHFMAIAKAMGFRLSNVSTAFTATPPDVARQKILASSAVLAICTRRDELKAGGYVMPQAVHDEISFAYGAEVPVLMIVENGIQLAGFKSNFGSYLSFDRTTLSAPDALEKAVEAIYILKMSVTEPHHLGAAQGVSECHADYVHHQIELKFDKGQYVWRYNTSKKLIYQKPSKKGFVTSVWATVPINLPKSPDPILFTLETISSSRNIKLAPDIRLQTAEKVEALVHLEPSPEENDHIEYATIAESRFINPVWLDEVATGGGVRLDDGEFKCADGLVFIHRTKTAIIELRFPREYGFRRSDVRPFVGSYSTSVDYEVASELERMTVKFDEFAGSLVLRLEISSPLPGHMYGVAWTPKPDPQKINHVLNPVAGGVPQD